VEQIAVPVTAFRLYHFHQLNNVVSIVITVIIVCCIVRHIQLSCTVRKII
jgi:hypothetical protein